MGQRDVRAWEHHDLGREHQPLHASVPRKPGGHQVRYFVIKHLGAHKVPID